MSICASKLWSFDQNCLSLQSVTLLYQLAYIYSPKLILKFGCHLDWAILQSKLSYSPTVGHQEDTGFVTAEMFSYLVDPLKTPPISITIREALQYLFEGVQVVEF